MSRTTTSLLATIAAVWASLSPMSGAHAAEPELATPRQALRQFVDACRTGRFDDAADVLDLRSVPAARRAEEGPRLARELKFVLDQKLWLDWDKISDVPEGDGHGIELVGTIPLASTSVPVRLVRSAVGDWHIGRSVVAAIPALYEAYGPGWIGDRMPPVLVEATFLDIAAWQWIGLFIALAAAAFVALVLGTIGRRIALRLARKTRFTWDDQLVKAASGPGRFLLGVATAAGAMRPLHLPITAQEAVDQVLRIATVVLFTWAGLRGIRFGAELLIERTSQAGDGASARTRLTQIMVLRRIAGFVTIVVGGALVLVQFDALRAVGTSLLASAGVAGIVIGLAAQRSIATLLAGLQISLTQPVRVGDIVVIEGEWGTIEEITLTYVVVKIWDLRRLVVPITKILDASFQNWTRAGTALLGTVFVYADYRVPVPDIRQELERFVKARPEWDGNAVGLQVTNATDRTIELRALVSAADSDRIWALRCAVREHLLAFVQRLDGGAYLPRTRIEPPLRNAPRNTVAPVARVPPPSAS